MTACLLAGGVALAQGQPAPGSLFVSFPTFRPQFHNDTETFSLLANFYIVNASPQILKDVTYRQTFPAEMHPKLVSEAIESRRISGTRWTATPT